VATVLWGANQVCYKSVTGSGRVKLIFEHNETFNSFFLLRGGPDWKGSQYCVSSSAVSDGLALTNGLKLGMTKRQVESVLGIPSYTAPNKYVYLFHELRTETVPAENEALEFEINASVELRFSEGKISYLRATRYEVN
jgi:SmpA / OmlA family